MRSVFATIAIALSVVSTAALPAPVLAQDASTTGRAISLEDVLRAVDERYPPLLGARAELDRARGLRTEAFGAFDLGLESKLKDVPNGFYEYSMLDAGITQRLGIWGGEVFGGYRRVTGDSLPDYYRERTQTDGEWRIGAALPLLKDGAIDAERTARLVTDFGVGVAEQGVARYRLDAFALAGEAYLGWIAAARQLDVSNALLTNATTRQAILEEQVAAGFRPEILLVDNQRVLLDARAKVLASEQKLIEARLKLSVYYRDENGDPIVPEPEVIAPAFGPLRTGFESNAPDLSDPQRPEILALELRTRSAQAEVDLAGNALLPKLDLTLGLSQNLGDDIYKDRTRTEFEVGGSFMFPVQQRSARGKLLQSEAKLLKAEQELRLARDLVSVEIQAAIAAVTAAQQRYELASQSAELAAQLLTAENERFAAGLSDFLDLQQREKTAFDAQGAAVDAQLEYLIAQIQLRLAAGLTPLG